MPKSIAYHLPNSTTLCYTGVEHFDQSEPMHPHTICYVVPNIIELGGQR